MPVPLFGWSVGDIVLSIQILFKIAEAFKDFGGAKDQFSETSTWLQSFANDLERVREYDTARANAKYTKNISQQVAIIEPRYFEFERYLQKYEPALSSNPTEAAPKKAARKVKWALKELKGHVDILKSKVSGPLRSVNLLLELQSL